MKSENFAEHAVDRPPRHWPQLRKQIEQIEAYRLIAHPTAEDAEVAAEKIDVSRATFYRLVRAYEMSNGAPINQRGARWRTTPQPIDAPGADVVLDVALLDLEAVKDGVVSLVGLLAMIDQTDGTVVESGVFAWPLTPFHLADLVLSAPRWQQPTPAVVVATPGIPTLSPRFCANWQTINMLPPIPAGKGLGTGGAIEATFGRFIGAMRILRRLPRRALVSGNALESTDVSAIIGLAINRHNQSLAGRVSSDI